VHNPAKQTAVNLLAERIAHVVRTLLAVVLDDGLATRDRLGLDKPLSEGGGGANSTTTRHDLIA
jgi:hypothetical protein